MSRKTIDRGGNPSRSVAAIASSPSARPRSVVRRSALQGLFDLRMAAVRSADSAFGVRPHVCWPTYTTASPHPMFTSVSRFPVQDLSL